MKQTCVLIMLGVLFYLGPAFGADEGGALPAGVVPVEALDNTGYFFEKLYPNPFSPVLDREFGLGDTSVVNIYLTDTALTDTTWIVPGARLAPGKYRIVSTPLFEFKERTGQSLVVTHLEAFSGNPESAGSLLTQHYRARALALVP